jgi:hypothetical protein
MRHVTDHGHHLIVTLPGSTGHVAAEDRVMLDRTLFSSWPIARIRKQYSKAYPHCVVEVTPLD